MSQGLIEIIGEDVLCSVVGGEGAELRLSYATSEARLKDWATRYDRAALRDREAELAAIGREMFAWLDEAGWATTWADGDGDRELEVRARRRDDPRELALLDAPWELLAWDMGALAGDALQPFSVFRRIGMPAASWEPQHGDLKMMFMAASPEGQVELDYEREEASILDATRGNGRVHVVVEETGALDFLGGRLASDEGPFEAVHLSCHGDIDARRGPVLVLESAEGKPHRATAADLMSALRNAMPQLVVLSACRTAEVARSTAVTNGLGRRDNTEGNARRDAAQRPADAGAEVTISFARQLTVQVANVIGWDGSVYDRDATDFAQTFYGELGLGAPVPRAAAVARQRLLEAHTQRNEHGRHWHLARVYLGPRGGGPLSAPRELRRRNLGHLPERAFLDKDNQRVPVATRAEFVGRRRAIQRVLRAFADDHGVLIHGMGALGKSSLAARVASRTPRRPVVIFERYDALSIFDKVLHALDPRHQLAEDQAWRERVKSNPASLANALQSWLEGPLYAYPILLIVDDLERILATPRPDNAENPAVGATADYRVPLGAVLRAFAEAQTASRLLLTSRYDIRHADGASRDLAADLVRVPLTPMLPRERIKQLRAAERLLARQDATDAAERTHLTRALEMAAGNPGLQALLTRPILAGEHAAATTALAQIDSYRQIGVPPAEIQALIDSGGAKDSENAVIAFFARLSIGTYRAALTPEQARQFSAATLFAEGVPIPRSALEAAGAALGVKMPGVAASRLLALGLLDDWDAIGNVKHAAVNPLARPLARQLEPADRPRLARAAMPHLTAAWRDPDGTIPVDARGLVASEIALEAGAEPSALEAASIAGAAWLARVQGDSRQALTLIERTISVLPAFHAVGPRFVRLGVECATNLGEMEVLQCLLRLPVRPSRPGDPSAMVAEAQLDLRRAEWLRQTGEVKQGEALTRKALAAFRLVGNERMAAIAANQIADFLQAGGDFDEALRIRREEVLPVYERLHEVREHAVALGKIADLLQVRGETDKALQIRLEEELPVYERINDARERSVVLQKIAAGLLAAGPLNDRERVIRAQNAAREAYDIARRLRLPDGIAHAGALLAELLGHEGLWREALAVLDEAETGFRKINDLRGHMHVTLLRAKISRHRNTSF